MRPGTNNRRPRNRNNNTRKSNIPNRNQVYESAGPENKVRGTSQQIFEKYQALARDALSSGNLVQAEAFFQHGEHYLRLHNLAVEAAAEAQEKRNQEQAKRREDRGDRGEQGEGDNRESREGRDNRRDRGDRGDRRDRGERGDRRNNRRFDNNSDRRDAVVGEQPDTETGNEATQPGAAQVVSYGDTSDGFEPASPMTATYQDPASMEQPDVGLPSSTVADDGSAQPSAEQPEPAPKRRGRPPKAKVEVADGEAVPDAAPKRRGRPPKAKVAEEEAPTDAPKRRDRPKKTVVADLPDDHPSGDGLASDLFDGDN